MQVGNSCTRQSTRKCVVRNSRSMKTVGHFCGIPSITNTNAIKIERKSNRVHRHRRGQKLAYHLRIQKWDKRFGTYEAYAVHVQDEPEYGTRRGLQPWRDTGGAPDLWTRHHNATHLQIGAVAVCSSPDSVAQFAPGRAIPACEL